VIGVLLQKPSLTEYHFPDPLDNFYFEDISGKISIYGDRFRLYAIDLSLFERAGSMQGVKNLLVDFCINPEFVHELRKAITICNIAQVKKARQFNINRIGR
jgi:uroporphyrinogen decarboxylase